MKKFSYKRNGFTYSTIIPNGMTSMAMRRIYNPNTESLFAAKYKEKNYSHPRPSIFPESEIARITSSQFKGEETK